MFSLTKILITGPIGRLNEPVPKTSPVCRFVQTEIATRVLGLFTSVFCAVDCFTHLLVGGCQAGYWACRKICRYSPEANPFNAKENLEMALWFLIHTLLIGSIANFMDPHGPRKPSTDEATTFTIIFLSVFQGRHNPPPQQHQAPNPGRDPGLNDLIQKNPPASREDIEKFFRENPDINLNEGSVFGSTALWTAIKALKPNVDLIGALVAKGAHSRNGHPVNKEDLEYILENVDGTPVPALQAILLNSPEPDYEILRQHVIDFANRPENLGPNRLAANCILEMTSRLLTPEWRTLLVALLPQLCGGPLHGRPGAIGPIQLVLDYARYIVDEETALLVELQGRRYAPV